MSTMKQRRMRLYNLGLTDKAIAEKEGVCRAAIRFWRKRNGLAPNLEVGGRGIPARDSWLKLTNEEKYKAKMFLARMICYQRLANRKGIGGVMDVGAFIVAYSDINWDGEGANGNYGSCGDCSLLLGMR